jgi:hypothetical protein
MRLRKRTMEHRFHALGERTQGSLRAERLAHDNNFDILEPCQQPIAISDQEIGHIPATKRQNRSATILKLFCTQVINGHSWLTS